MMNSAKEGQQTTKKTSPSPLRRMKKISTPILKHLFKFDNLFINGDQGFGLVVMAKKESQ